MERLLVAFLRRYIRRGSLKVTTAAGNVYMFGDGRGPAAAVRFTTARAQRAVLFDAELKLGEAYMDGTLVVERGSIVDLLAIAFRQEWIPAPRWAWPPRLARYLFRRLQQFNSRFRARRNVAHHYDLDGRLYSLFLDGDQQYSCAYFETAGRFARRRPARQETSSRGQAPGHTRRGRARYRLRLGRPCALPRGDLPRAR